MKHTKKTTSIPLLALCLLLLFTSCGDGGADADHSAELEGYRTQIALLQAELQEQKQAQYISESEYKQQIEQLQQKIAILENPSEESDGGEEQVMLHYELREGKAVITGAEGDLTLLSIPETGDGYPVIAIGERAFEGKSIVSVTLPAGMNEIGWFAFAECSRLLTVSIPASVVTIHYGAFDGSNALTIRCPKGSYAAEFAASFGLRVAYDADEAK